MITRFLISRFIISALLAVTISVQAQEKLGTELKAENLDANAFASLFAGVETPMTGTEGGSAAAMWTNNPLRDWRGVTFGNAATPGVRYLRIGFKAPLTVGSVLVRGGGSLSVLKSNAAYPGKLDEESQWVPATRLLKDQASKVEVDREEYAIWNLPPGTQTRALRFTHTANPADPAYAGWLGGAYLFSERLTNIAPEATVSASAREEEAGKVNDNSSNKTWQVWDNGKEGASVPIAPDHPEWLILTWPNAVKLRGLNALWSGFSSAEVQAYIGPPTRHPRESHNEDWKTIRSFSGMENGYPLQLWPNWMDFGDTVTTRAVRLLLTGAVREGHPHLHGNTKDGKRVWVGELQALVPLGKDDLGAFAKAMTLEQVTPPPPIPIHFTLPKEGYVTLVIDDARGKRVRNLLSETRFPAGANIAWWDGADDLGRDRDAARHGLYHIPEQSVSPGEYHVRGLFHEGIDLRYEMSVYNGGNPPWETSDTSGGWLTNHTPPRSILFVPGERSPTGQPLVYIGSPVAEGGAGLAWVDLDGKKIGGRGWVGGTWTGAPSLARDDGKNALPEVFAYVGASWRTESGSEADREKYAELRLTALTSKGDKPVLKHRFVRSTAHDAPNDQRFLEQLGGIAVHDGILVCSLTDVGSLLFVDARAGQAIGEAPVASPRGMAFDSEGRLLVLSETKLLRFKLDPNAPAKLPSAETIISSGLEDPKDVALDSAGQIYVSDAGQSHQVKRFCVQGKIMRTFGIPGAPAVGPYDPLHMNNPRGITIDSKGRLWVAEYDYEPKRVSIWSADGKLEKAFYGPSQYGGGGTLDPEDKSRFYYNGMEFHLDWEHGTNQLASIYYRPDSSNLPKVRDAFDPQVAIHFQGRQYMTNCYSNNPTNGAAFVSLWQLRNGVAAPVASFGRTSEWPLLKTDEFRTCWGEHAAAADKLPRDAVYIWSDLNGDGRAQPQEVAIITGHSGGVTLMSDLSFVESRLDGKAMRFPPKSFTPSGVPLYDLAAGQVILEGAQDPTSTGGDQVLTGPNGWSIFTTAPKPFAPEGPGGAKDGKPLWSYPSAWPGLHASHESAVPDHPGELVGTTRLLGGIVTPGKGEAGPLWCLNGNMGPMYLFTVDGLFVSQLFQDSRTGKPWSMPSAQRGMVLNDITPHDENFFPSINGSPDGNIYIVDGARTALVRLDGLEKVRRLPETKIQVTDKDLQAAQAWRIDAEAKRQLARGTGTLKVAIRTTAPQVDGKLDDWAGAEWAIIDRRGTAANFNSDSKPYNITGAVTISGDRLYAAFRTQDADLLKNSGAVPLAPFKTGGALDLMIGADAKTDPKRAHPTQGDIRLLVTRVKDKPVALVYRPVASGTKSPVPFSSPWRTITMDRVDDVSSDVQLASSIEKDSNGRVASAVYELSIPLTVLGWKPSAGESFKADIGILRGDGAQTLQRSYWNNKATGITADVPSEAELTPSLWGTWIVNSQD